MTCNVFGGMLINQSINVDDDNDDSDVFLKMGRTASKLVGQTRAVR